jgi:xanthine dehydrogenase/oxidase
VSIKVRRTGGAFGGKGSRSIIPACSAALAAHVLGTPVSVALNIYSDQAMSGTRMTMEANVKVAFEKSSGRMSALEVGMYVAGGAFEDATAGAIRELVLHVDGVYSIPNWEVVAKACRLNVAPRTFVRAPGHLQSTLIIESALDRIAEVTGLDPVAVRECNLYTARSAITPYLAPMLGLGFSLPRVWDRIKVVGELAHKQHDIDIFNKANRWRKRGLAVSPVKYGVGAMRGGSLVSVDKDGTVSVFHSGVELGQGIHTRVAQVAAMTLGAPLECVVIQDTNTDVVSQIGVTGGSGTTGSAAEAVRVACLKLNANMAVACSSSQSSAISPSATSDKDVKMKAWVDKVTQAVSWGVEMSVEAHAFDAAGKSGDPRGGADGAWAKAPGAPMYSQYCFGAACSVVEVDCLTGQTTLLQTDIVYDMGKSMNPALDIGQIEGAFMMGVGYHLHEEVLYGKADGRVVSNGTWEYKPPCAADVPRFFNVELLRDSPFMKGTLRAKAVGEPPQMLSVSVFAATRRAVMASRVERGLDPWAFDLGVPATVDRVQQALQIEGEHF